MKNNKLDLEIQKVAIAINSLFDNDEFQLSEDDFDCLWNEINIPKTSKNFNKFLEYKEKNQNHYPKCT